MSPRLTIDFFHDVVCGWCFNISPRLRALADEFDLAVHHRTFVLQDSRERMIEVFGSMSSAKETILRHWAACRRASYTPELFNIEGMRAAPFEYPFGLPAALACQASERIGGPAAHWDMFDRLQKAHITEARNVADPGVLISIAKEAWYDPTHFSEVMAEFGTRRAVERDRQCAHRLQVRSVPTLIVRETGARLVNGPIEDLRAQLRVALKLAA